MSQIINPKVGGRSFLHLDFIEVPEAKEELRAENFEDVYVNHWAVNR